MNTPPPATAQLSNSPAQVSPQQLIEPYRAVRKFSGHICQPLETEDYLVQSMPDVSPTRWHLAHTTWFFETFVLARWQPDYQPANPTFEYLFNSYYNTVGQPFPRAKRGLLTRPTVAEVFEYRQQVDERIVALLEWFDSQARDAAELCEVLRLGLHHEQQHQELMLTDLKHVFSCNPLYPAYRAEVADNSSDEQEATPLSWTSYDEQLIEIGVDSGSFSYDNERPRHRTFVESYQLADRLITNGEYLQFIEDEGYRRPELWLSLGWSTVEQEQWQAPLYWVEREGQWFEFTLSGLQPLVLAAPVSHVSFFEADAFARYSHARLPTEAEWEHAASQVPCEGSFVEGQWYHPRCDATNSAAGPRQLFGELWQWTASPYVAYPGYQPPPGALGEYNGKFMCNQYVLRGGSCATSRTHIRPSYRNFFPPEARWQFSGVRLAR